MFNSPALHDSPGDPDDFGLTYTVTTANAKEAESSVLTRANEKGHHCLQALHLPWPRVPVASSSRAGLRKPLLQNPRRWSPEHMVRQGTCEKTPLQSKAMLDTPVREDE